VWLLRTLVASVLALMVSVLPATVKSVMSAPRMSSTVCGDIGEYLRCIEEYWDECLVPDSVTSKICILYIYLHVRLHTVLVCRGEGEGWALFRALTCSGVGPVA